MGPGLSSPWLGERAGLRPLTSQLLLPCWVLMQGRTQSAQGLCGPCSPLVPPHPTCTSPEWLLLPLWAPPALPSALGPGPGHSSQLSTCSRAWRGPCQMGPALLSAVVCHDSAVTAGWVTTAQAQPPTGGQHGSPGEVLSFLCIHEQDGWREAVGCREWPPGQR